MELKLKKFIFDKVDVLGSGTRRGVMLCCVVLRFGCGGGMKSGWWTVHVRRNGCIFESMEGGSA